MKRHLIGVVLAVGIGTSLFAQARVFRTETLIAVTDVEPQKVRVYFTEFQKLHDFFRSQNLPLSPVPVIAFIPAKSRDARKYFPGHVQAAGAVGMALSSEDQSYIIYPADSTYGLEGFRHEAVHALLRQAFKGMPDWIDEGAAEYFSTIRFENGQAVLGIAPKQSENSDRCVESRTLAGQILVKNRNASFYRAAWTLFKKAIEGVPLEKIGALQLPSGKVCPTDSTINTKSVPVFVVPEPHAVEDEAAAHALVQDYSQHMRFATGSFPSVDPNLNAGAGLEQTWLKVYVKMVANQTESARELVEEALARFPSDPRLQFYQSRLP